jgi:hypothetical protein
MIEVMEVLLGASRIVSLADVGIDSSVPESVSAALPLR